MPYEKKKGPRHRHFLFSGEGGGVSSYFCREATSFVYVVIDTHTHTYTYIHTHTHPYITWETRWRPTQFLNIGERRGKLNQNNMILVLTFKSLHSNEPAFVNPLLHAIRNNGIRFFLFCLRFTSASLLVLISHINMQQYPA